MVYRVCSFCHMILFIVCGTTKNRSNTKIKKNFRKFILFFFFCTFDLANKFNINCKLQKQQLKGTHTSKLNIWVKPMELLGRLGMVCCVFLSVAVVLQVLNCIAYTLATDQLIDYRPNLYTELVPQAISRLQVGAAPTNSNIQIATKC